jgi:hypothetical protein
MWRRTTGKPVVLVLSYPIIGKSQYLKTSFKIIGLNFDTEYFLYHSNSYYPYIYIYYF